ncbi:MAG TPA: hypothetical protein VJY66_04505 [Acholeplasma sp.]|nr:hypothetical protein [Acholeplasma sp.]
MSTNSVRDKLATIIFDNEASIKRLLNMQLFLITSGIKELFNITTK